jgi:hypothetical protein
MPARIASISNAHIAAAVERKLDLRARIAEAQIHHSLAF